MIAINNLMGTEYDCNLFQKGPNMIAILKKNHEIRPESIVT